MSNYKNKVICVLFLKNVKIHKISRPKTTEDRKMEDLIPEEIPIATPLYVDIYYNVIKIIALLFIYNKYKYYYLIISSL